MLRSAKEVRQLLHGRGAEVCRVDERSLARHLPGRQELLNQLPGHSYLSTTRRASVNGCLGLPVHRMGRPCAGA